MIQEDMSYYLVASLVAIALYIVANSKSFAEGRIIAGYVL